MKPKQLIPLIQVGGSFLLSLVPLVSASLLGEKWTTGDAAKWALIIAALGVTCFFVARKDGEFSKPAAGGLYVAGIAVAMLPHFLAMGLGTEMPASGMFFLLLILGGAGFVVIAMSVGFFESVALLGGKSGTHGTATWADTAEVAENLKDGVLLGTLMKATERGGRSTGQPVRTEQHILTVAPTGAGKGRYHLIPHLLSNTDASMVVLDLKGELHAVTSRWRRQQGHECWVWDPYAVTRGDRCTFDLLRALDPDSPDAVGDAVALAEALVIEVSGREGEAHWSEAARQLLTGLLLHASATRQHDIGVVRDWVAMSLAEVLAEMTSSKHTAVRRAAGAQLARPEKEAASIVSTLTRHLAWLDDPRLADAVGPGSRLAGRDFRDRPVTLYLCVPPDRVGPAARAVRAITWLLLRDLTRQHQGRKVIIALDEMAQLGRMESLEKAIAIARGYRIQLWMLVQSLSQLRAAYGQHDGTLVANSLLVAWAVSDHQTAQLLSQVCGTQTVASNSHSYTPGKPLPAHSQSDTGRALITADEIRTLGPQQAIVIARSVRPAVVDLPDYLKDPTYSNRADPNPMHA